MSRADSKGPKLASRCSAASTTAPSRFPRKLAFANDGCRLRGEVNPGQSERINNLNHADSWVLYDGVAKFFFAGSALL